MHGIAVVFFLLISHSNGYEPDIPWPPIKNKTLCEKQMELYQSHLTLKKPWAMKMHDATPKDPVGLYTGNWRDFGSFHQCVSTEYRDDEFDIIGKYCTYGVRMLKRNPIPHDDRNIQQELEDLTEIVFPEEKALGPKIKFTDLIVESLSLCLPDACTPSEAKKYLDYPILTYYNDKTCQTKELFEEFDVYDLTTVVILLCICLVIVSSTIYEYYLIKTNKQPISELLLAFSVITNIKNLLTVDKKATNARIPCIEGIRSFSTMWMLCGNELALIGMPIINGVAIITFIKERWLTSFLLGVAYAVDSFLFVSGCVLSYGYLKSRQHKKNGGKFNVLYFYLHRFLRLTPALAALYLLQVSVMRRLTTGPLYPYITNFHRNVCIDHWWSYFLYIQNYVNSSEMCVPRTGYLSIDMQLYILSPILLFPLIKYPKCTMAALWILVLASVLWPFFILYNNEVRLLSKKMFDLYWYKTHTRATPYLIGLFTGILVAKVDRIRINWFLNLFLWIAVYCGFFTIMTIHNNFYVKLTTLETAIFLPLSKLAWSLGLCFVVVASTKGHGGVMNWFLSLSLFQVMGKLSYAIFLTHGLFITYFVGRDRTTVFFSISDLMFHWSAYILLSSLFSILWVLFFESPVIAFETSLFGYNVRKYGKSSQAEIKEIKIHTRED